MAHALLNVYTLKKLGVLLRDHRWGQVANTLRFALHAVRGFPSARLPYDPVCLTLFTTSRCNLRCRFCQYRSPETPRQALRAPDMSLETLDRILARYWRATSISVSGGGEPLVHPRLFDMVRLGHERRMKVHVVTSGTLLPGKVDAVLGAPIDFLNVSLYGVDGESFAETTGADASLFGRTVEAMREIVRRRPRGGYPRVFRASFVCTKANMHRALDFIRLCEEIGLDQAKLKNLTFYAIPGHEESMCLHEDDPAARELVDGLSRQRFRIPVFLPRLYRREHTPRRCQLPFRELSIDGDGFMAPCPILEPFPRHINILEDPGAWNGPEMVRLRRELVDTSRPLPTPCLHCEKMIQSRPRAGTGASRGSPDDTE